MKNKKMTSWGCGPKILLIVLITAVPLYLVQFLFFPDFRIPVPSWLAFLIGGIWFVSGIPVWFFGAREINKNFLKKQLVTTGIFRYIQHPIYCAFGLFYIPALVFMSRSWIGFILPLLFYILFLCNIKYEENYLETLFGETYSEYKKQTGRIIPKLIKGQK